MNDALPPNWRAQNKNPKKIAALGYKIRFFSFFE